MHALKKRLLYYGENTNLHGLRYVADEKRPVYIRIFWVLIFILSFVGMLIIFKGSYASFQDNAISFVTETTYLDWDTKFPTITICEITGSEVVWTPEPIDDYQSLQQFIADLIFFTGSCYSCNAPCKSCQNLNFREIVKLFRKPCDKIMKKCKWNDFEFDCCDKFLPLETEYGVCFSLNSLHTRKTKKSAINMNSNRKSGPGQLLIQTIDDVRVRPTSNSRRYFMLELRQTLKVVQKGQRQTFLAFDLYLHAEEDVPFINSDPDQRKDVMLGETYNITFNVLEIKNDENVINVPVEKRGCRFPTEKPETLKVHQFYSYSTCVVQCHAEAHINLCNCTHHLMPAYNLGKYCGIEGLQCLTDYFETVNRLHAKDFDKPGLVCDCVPSCVEPEFKVVTDSKGVKTSHSEILIKMDALPTSRFKRTVVRTMLDLVVSIGGTAGLFVGASLLSIVETIYLFCHKTTRR